MNSRIIQVKLGYQENIALMEEMEKELTLRNHIEYLKDLDREYVGLSPLSSFNSLVENEFFSSEFYNELNEINNIIYETRDRIDDICASYDEFLELLFNIPLSNISETLFQLKYIGIKVDSKRAQGIFDLQEFLKDKYENIQELKLGDFDYDFEFGHSYEIYSFEQTKYQLIIPNLDLYPFSGETDEIDIKLEDEVEVISKVVIEICYGYVINDDNYNVQDAEEESISINDCGIIDKLKELLKEWDKNLKREEEFVNNIKKYLK